MYLFISKIKGETFMDKQLTLPLSAVPRLDETGRGCGEIKLSGLIWRWRGGARGGGEGGY